MFNCNSVHARQYKSTSTIELRALKNNQLEQISNKLFISDVKPEFRLPDQSKFSSILKIVFLCNKIYKRYVSIFSKNLGMSLFFLFCFVFYWGLRVIPLAQARDGGFFNKMKGVFALGYDRLSSVKCSSFCVNNILNIYIQRVTT